MKHIKLSDLIEALEFDSQDCITKVDLEQGRVVTIEESVHRAVEEGDEELLSGLASWQKEQVEIARALAEDSGKRFLCPPDKFDFHEYRQMERFIGALENSEAVEQLWRAIKGKGAFCQFKDTAARLGLLDAWFKYRDHEMKQYVIDWAEANQVQVVDDVRDKPAR